MTYRNAFEQGKNLLSQKEITDCEIDARLLLEFVCKTDRNALYIYGDRELSSEQENQYFSLINKRAEHIPLQHLTNVQNFMGIDFYVNGDVLIPRQDTEILVEEALLVTHDGDRVLDMCTGSGCIILSTMCYKNDIIGVGVDISEAALSVAKKNYESLAASGRINGKAEFIQSDMFSGVEGQFEVILSNPPYIKTSDISELSDEVKEHDPFLALNGGEDGLDFYRCIAQEAEQYLLPEGYLIVEIGYDQGTAVKDIFEKAGYDNVEIIKDLAGLDRVVKGQRLF